MPATLRQKLERVSKHTSVLAGAAIGALLGTSTTANAVLLAYEGFNYTSGAVLSGQNGGYGFGDNSWVLVNQGTDPLPTVVNPGSLVFEGNPSSAASGTGNSAFTDQNDRRSRFLDTTESGPFAQYGYIDSNGNIGADGKTLYISFLQQSGADLPDSFFEFELHRDNLGDPGRVAGIGDDAPGDNMNLRTGSIDNQSLGPRDLNVNLYVMKIQFQAGNDTVSVYRNPTGTTEPATATYTATNADVSFDGISMAAFIGAQTVTTDEIRMGTTFSDVITGTAPGNPTRVLADPNRPGYHFTAPANWLNDPNGLIYANGQYNMFYQTNPSGPTASSTDISWGHAVSTDLVHWTYLPTAIPADSNVQAWSGSAVIDTNNTAGFGAGAMVAIYAGSTPNTFIQDQQLAYSTDGGKTFTKYGEIIPATDAASATRDPSVFWYAPKNTWVMAVSRTGTDDSTRPAGIEIYQSSNLKNWTYMSTTAGGGGWECPDLFQMPINGDPNNTAWVMMGSINDGVDYRIGTFDGTTFVPQQTIHADHGFDYYAAQVYNGLQGQQGRTVVTAWMANPSYATQTPSTLWQGQMTIPRQLTLTETNGTFSILTTPVPELQSLRTPIPVTLGSTITSTIDPLAGTNVKGDQLEIVATIAAGTATSFGFEVRKGPGQETIIGYDVAGGDMYVDRDHASSVSTFNGTATGPLTLEPDGTIKFDIFVDESSVEVFANDGQLAMSDLVFPDPASDGVSLFAEGGTAQLISFQAYQMSNAINVPEPATMSLITLGLTTVGKRRKRRVCEDFG